MPGPDDEESIVDVLGAEAFPVCPCYEPGPELETYQVGMYNMCSMIADIVIANMTTNNMCPGTVGSILGIISARVVSQAALQPLIDRGIRGVLEDQVDEVQEEYCASVESHMADAIRRIHHHSGRARLMVIRGGQSVN